MPLPLPPPPGAQVRLAARARGGARVRRPVLAGLAALALLLAAGGCARPDEFSFTPEALDRDRAARAAVVAEIERDHETLAALIASDRFEAPDAIYTDPELRAVALHLVEHARSLRRLSESDVLAPGAP